MKNKAYLSFKLDFSNPLQLIIRLFGLTVLWLVLSMMFGSTKAQACGLTLTPNPGPLPSGVRNYLECANDYPMTPAYRPFIAAIGDPTQTTITVPAGTTSIALGWRNIGTVGWSHNNPCCGLPRQAGWTLDNHSQVQSVSASGPTGVGTSGVNPGNRLDLNGFNNSPGFTAQGVLGYNLVAPGGFVSGTYTTTFTIRSINHYSTGRYQCVAGRQSPTTADNFGPCDNTQVSISIQVIVQQPPQRIEGRIWDQSNGAGIGGVQIETCRGYTVWTDGAGFYRFDVPYGEGFCARVVGGVPGGYVAPTTWPWNEGYTPDCGPNARCIHGAYECQVAGVNASDACGIWWYDYDRAQNNGFDFTLLPMRRVEGRIWNEFTGVGIGGVQVETCRGYTVWTDGAGFYRFDVPYGDWHCARVVGGVPGNLDPATTRTWPWAEGYAGCAANTTCWATTYEWQRAGGDFDGGGWDRGRDNGFDFHIRPRRPPTGSIDGVSCTWLWGRASDPDYAGSIRVHIYVDGPVGGGGTYAGQAFTDGAGNYTFNVSPWEDYSTHSFYAYGIGKDVNGNEDGYNFPALANSGASSPAPGCARPTCGPVSSTPANPQPGQSFTLSARFLYNPGSRGRPISQSRGHIMSLSVTPGVYNNTNQSYVAYDPVPGYPGNAGTATVNGLVAPLAGSYDVNMYVSNVNFIGCGPSQVIVASRPYFRAYGGDVASGYNFLASPSAPCSAPTGVGRRIIGWNDSTGSGSGVELAAFALGLVDQFSSATVRQSGGLPDRGPPLPVKGATFANNGNFDADSPYGGGLGTQNENCPHNYFAYSAGKTFVNVPPGIGVNLASPPYTTNGIYYRDSNAAPQPVRIIGTTLPAGRRVTIFVNHDVRLESDINYATTWADITQIPNLTVIVRGNIYIPPGTRNLSGIFIAQDDGTGTKGRIYTCTNSSGNGAPSASDLMPGGPCANKLTVFGSFIAESLRLFRASGTQITSSGPQEYTDGNISEAIIFSPEVWLAAPKFGNSTRDDFDSYSSMPPVF